MTSAEAITKELNKLGYTKCKVETKSVSWHTNIYVKFNNFYGQFKIEIINSGCGVMQISQYSGLTITDNLEQAFKYLFSLNRASYITTLGTESRVGIVINDNWQKFFEKLGFVKLIEYPNLQHGVYEYDSIKNSSDKQSLYFLNCANNDK
jgi:hypothetical protein